MKKIIFPILIVILLLAACGQSSDNIIFTALIEKVNGANILVSTSDDVGFDKASVDFDDKLEIPFNLLEGQTVLIEALPLIRESYPVQITAVKITLKKSEKLSEIPESLKAEYKKITPQQATEMMTGDEIILDVRTQSEFDEGHIVNAILLTDSDIEQKAEEVLLDKEQVILVYCRSGRRSKLAAEQLIELGYQNVYDFGGILDWTGKIVK